MAHTRMGSLFVILWSVAAVFPCLGAAPTDFVQRSAEEGRVPFASFADRLERSGIRELAFRDSKVGSEQKIQIIRMAYDLLEDYGASDVSDLRFELSDFEPLYREQLAQRRYTEIMTMPGGLVLDVIRSRHSDDTTGVVTVHFKPKWKELEASAMKAPDGRPLESMVVSEVLAEIEDEGYLDLAAVDMIITYRVVATLRGESREYQAAFYWYPGTPEKEISFLVMDHVSQGVEKVLAEAEPPVFVPQATADEVSQLEPQHGRSSVECREIPPQPNPLEPPPKTGFGGHLTGQHRMKAVFDARCSCSSSCTSTCQASVVPLQCVDQGILYDALCHKMSEGDNSSSQSNGNGMTQGAQCSAGFGCAAKSCTLGCTCAGAGVTVNAGPGGVNFTFGSGTIWTGSHEHSAVCFLCTEVPPEEPINEPPGGEVCCETPIIIDLGRPGLRLTSLADGVHFDLDGDGSAERVSWTEEGAADAFLALDINTNGVIDDGGELFGDLTAQKGTTGRNGFKALAVYDIEAAGGNGDRRMSHEDTFFELLLLWTDRNHDGVSQRSELEPLRSVVQQIDLEYWEARQVDGYGNQMRYRSHVKVEALGIREAIDVILQTKD